MSIGIQKRLELFSQIALKTLPKMYLSNKGLFSYSCLVSSGQAKPTGLSARYSAIALIGLLRAGVRKLNRNTEILDILHSTTSAIAQGGNLGDKGLCIWASAEADAGSADFMIEDMLGSRHAVAQRASQLSNTGEIAWVLCGLCRYFKRVGFSDRLARLITAIRNVLARNQDSTTGLFAYSSTRPRYGFFSDQVYPILALSIYSRLFNDENATSKALRCAETICRLQGNLGQWWWLYEPGSGRVLDPYPVFSVHQDAMLPMALLDLQHTTGKDFSEHISRGFDWLFSRNELSVQMVDAELGMIWRAIGRKRLLGHLSIDSVSNLIASRGAVLGRGPFGLAVIYECRPYHLGWILAASKGFLD